MIEIPPDVQRLAEQAHRVWIAGGADTGGTVTAVAVGILAERERVAKWHDAQATRIDEEVGQAAVEGRILPPAANWHASFHRDAAAAIRAGMA